MCKPKTKHLVQTKMNTTTLPLPSSLFWQSPALTVQSSHYPAHFGNRIPLRIVMMRRVAPDAFASLRSGLKKTSVLELGGTYEAWTNMHGAVAGICADGGKLGVKPGEFEVVEWYEKPANTTPNMAGKPVLFQPAKAVLNLDSGFAKKLLCDGPTFSTGLACVFGCTYCYVPSVYRKLLAPMLEAAGKEHHEVVIRRTRAVEILRGQLTHKNGDLKYPDSTDRRVIYSSPAVDCAANIELANETVAACAAVLEMTNWQIRLLSKSNLLPFVAKKLSLAVGAPTVAERVIFGVSTGTLDDGIAMAIEPGTAKVSKRLASLYALQDDGFRTFGMICPSLPQADYARFAMDMHAALRADKLEHVWAEPLNVRGDSMKRTLAALNHAGYKDEAEWLQYVSEDRVAWEEYARDTFLAHAPLYRPGQLRFLQYTNNANREWWTSHQEEGAVLL